jgi:protein-L-isoaspartate(D-aspartate) O-methyltransferase
VPRPQSDSAKLRRHLVVELHERGVIRSDLVRDAFLAVPREAFLPEFVAREGLEAVYRDDAIPTKFDANGITLSSSSQPAIMAEMLEELALEPGMRVLEIGAGTGYNAAVLAEIVGPRGAVTTIEVDPAIARGARAALRRGKHRATVVVGDGREGFADRAPYDRILVTASADTVPRAWFDQLADGGLLEVPLRLTAAGAQVIPTLRKRRSRLASVATIGGGFMPLRAPDENGAVPSRPPCLIASDVTGEQPRDALRQISGDSLTTLSSTAKRRLLITALADGHRRPLRLRADPNALVLYLMLTLARTRVVELFPGAGVGLITRDGASLAYVESRVDVGAVRWISSLTAHGDSRAEEALATAVSEWDELGRPGPRQLRVSVVYRRDEARLRRSWRRT